jgi:hypothetical protein
MGNCTSKPRHDTPAPQGCYNSKPKALDAPEAIAKTNYPPTAAYDPPPLIGGCSSSKPKFQSDAPRGFFKKNVPPPTVYNPPTLDAPTTQAYSGYPQAYSQQAIASYPTSGYAQPNPYMATSSTQSNTYPSPTSYPTTQSNFSYPATNAQTSGGRTASTNPASTYLAT